MMENSKHSYRSSSISSVASSQQNPTNGLKALASSDFEYVGRLVTRERPVIRTSNSIQQSYVFPQNKNKYFPSNASQRQNIYEEQSTSSSDGDDNSDGLSKPLGVIKISDRHVREIYRLPTPPPKIKRVYHRLKSPDPKVIERVFVRRPPPQIIENIIEIPPEKVRIINREKYLGKSEPITRSKIVKLKSRHRHREVQEEEEGEEDDYDDVEERQPQQTYMPSEQYAQQPQTTMQSSTYQPAAETSLVYPPQPNTRTVGYFESTIPPEIMLNSKNPMQLASQQSYNDSTIQPTSAEYASQEQTMYQPAQPINYGYASQQPSAYRSPQSTMQNYALQQQPVYQPTQPMMRNYAPPQLPVHQVTQPTTPNYASQQLSAQPSPYYLGRQPTSAYQTSQPSPYYFPTQ
ncbi:unnamed protein product [Rotaria socialis]|uniref:Uncharacterized protein n=1 Tax=Rotaria socialis TaxID=392032 RepID=A0A817UNW7_9BILA|nr:unnamed protein product [Rotaria socialis]CAF3348896.1 unnamed protein product [Rotaria socialis]CAF3639316.1 unnamed protein product [Rotaria socialis]CAF4291876.1 unnamed protein product [Rotaria socialis]CAF4406266.1 unnamed protein product [Rotaria socialis]